MLDNVEQAGKCDQKQYGGEVAKEATRWGSPWKASGTIQRTGKDPDPTGKDTDGVHRWRRVSGARSETKAGKKEEAGHQVRHRPA